MNDQHLRMSDAEREQATSELGEHFAQGRLTADEHGERLDQIWSARTRGELVPIFADLPGRDGSPSTRPSTRSVDRSGSAGGHWQGRLRSWRRGLPTPVFVILAVLLVALVITHLPLIVFALLVWFFVLARHRNRRYARRW